jgi:hypothetical protein
LRVKGRDSGEFGRQTEITCGAWVCVLKTNGSYWWKKPCGKWTCKECREIKIAEWQGKISAAIPGPHVFIQQLDQSGRSLSQWVQRHVPKECDYFTVKKPGGAVLVTRYKIRGSSRKSKKKFLEGEFADLLRDPSIEGRRITCRNNNKKKVKAGGCCGFFITDNHTDDGREVKKEHRRILQEYGDIKSEIDRGKWLTEHRENIFLFPEGERLIEAYRMHRENGNGHAIENEDNE